MHSKLHYLYNLVPVDFETLEFLVVRLSFFIPFHLVFYVNQGQQIKAQIAKLMTWVEDQFVYHVPMFAEEILKWRSTFERLNFCFCLLSCNRFLVLNCASCGESLGTGHVCWFFFGVNQY